MFSCVRCSRCLLPVLLVGVLGCGAKPAPDAPQAGETRAAADQREKPSVTEPRALEVPAILELSVPEGVRVEIDGKDIGEQRRHRFAGMDLKKFQQRTVSLRFPDGKEVKRILLVRGGEVIRLAFPKPDMTRPDLVLQTGHTDPVNAVAFSPDGKHVLTGSVDNTTVLWDAVSGQKLRAFLGHTHSVAAVTFSPDGKQVLTSSEDKTAILWDAASGKKLRVFLGHTAKVAAVAFSPDGKQILTGSRDHTAMLWEAASGQKLRAFQGNLNCAVAFSPNGKQVLINSSDNTAVLWDAASGQKLRAFQGHTKYVTSVAFSPNGKQVLTSSEDDTAILWDAASGQKLRTFRVPKPGPLFKNYAVAFSPDGKPVLTGIHFHVVQLWDVASGRTLGIFRYNQSIRAVALSPDVKQILTSGLHDQTTVLWDVASGQKLRAFRGPIDSITAVAISSDGKQVHTGYAYNTALWLNAASGQKPRTFTAVLWDTASGQKLHTFQGPTDWVHAVAFSPDGKQVLTGSGDRTAVLWDAANGQKLRTFLGHADWVYAVAFSPDGKQVLTGSKDKTAVLWDAVSDQKLRAFQGQTHWVYAVAFSPDGKQVFTGFYDYTAVLWEAASGQKLCTFEGHTRPILAVVFSPDGKQVLTGSGYTPKTSTGTRGNMAVLWDTASGLKLRDFQGHTDSVDAVAFSPNGKQVLTGSADYTAILWDAASGQKLCTFVGHTHYVNCVVFSPDGKLLLTGSHDGTIRLWDIASGDELCRLISIDAGKDWAVVTPEGLFDGSKGGREKSYFREGTGLSVVPLDNFFQDFYYPGLLAAIWRGERPMPGKPFQISPAPSIKMLVQGSGVRGQGLGVRSQESGVRSQESAVRDSVSRDAKSSERSAGSVTIDVAVTDRGGGSKAPWIKHNRATVRAGNTLVRKEEKTENHRFSLALIPGENKIEARSATADGGVESEPAGITIPFDGKLPDPELHVVSVGINLYAPNAGVKNLRYCVADAEGIADLLQKRAAKSYGKVHVTRLLDDKATKAEILKTLSELSKTVKPQDTLVFFCASHGVTLGQRYFLIPHDLKMGEENPREDLRKGALAVDELSEPLAAIPALKRVLIFDTCESGSATSLAGKENNPFAFRGAAERLNRAQGVYCLAGATATEKAAESRDLKHSILTYTLLAGAGAVDKGPLAGLKVKGGDAGLDVLDWFRYARQNVPLVYEEVRGKAQNIEISGEDQPGFPLLSP